MKIPRCRCPSEVKIPVCILTILFGMGSWIAVNGLWVELPILVHEAPEGWNLPSYITVLIQIANLGPLLYTIVHKCFPSKFNEKHGVYIIVFIGAAACLMLVFLWKETAYVAGADHSVGLLVSVLLLSMVDCTSSVVFLPYMATFKQEYMTSFYIGEGMSGLVPAAVALGQNVGKTLCLNKTINATTNETQIVGEYVQPHFPVEDFFYFLFAMILLSGFAFTLLNYLPYCRREHVPEKLYALDKEIDADSKEHEPDINGSSIDMATGYEKIGSAEPIIQKRTPLRRSKYLYLLLLIGIINALTNGVIPSVSSYATLPYGDSPFHLTATLMNIANPLACVLAFFVTIYSAGVFTLIVSVGCFLAAYILVIAAYSPEPPMVGETAGSVVIVSFESVNLFNMITTFVLRNNTPFFGEVGAKKGALFY